MPEGQPVEKPDIKVMPNKDVLERFLLGFHGVISVYFDHEKGEFVDMNKPVSKPKEQKK